MIDKIKRQKGFSLLELIVALGMLSGLLILTFVALRMSTQVFSEGTVRQSAEQQLKVIRLLLERDIELTTFWYAGIRERKDSENKERDALSLVTLSDWQDNTLFDNITQRPAWNRYIVWYATLQEPGKLIRQVIKPTAIPTPPGHLNSPYASLADNIKDNPEANSNVTSTRYLSEGVTGLSASQRLENGTITIKLHLLAEGSLRGLSAEKVQNHLEVTWAFRPKNSWPQI